MNSNIIITSTMLEFFRLLSTPFGSAYAELAIDEEFDKLRGLLMAQGFDIIVFI